MCACERESKCGGATDRESVCACALSVCGYGYICVGIYIHANIHIQMNAHISTHTHASTLQELRAYDLEVYVSLLVEIYG